MKKKSILVLLPLLALTSCGKQPIDAIVENFDNVMTYGDHFDTSKINMIYQFDDEITQVANTDDITYSFPKGFSMFQLDTKVNLGSKKYKFSKEVEFKTKERNSLSLLFIGNSFSEDTINFMNEICNDLEISANLVLVYRGSSSVDDNLKGYVDNLSLYEARKWDTNNKCWRTTKFESIKPNVISYDWDFVSIQQVSGESGLLNKYDSAATYASTVINDFVDKLHTQLVWNMTWAYDEDSGHADFSSYNHDQMIMYNGILDCVNKKILTNDDFATVIPNGTTIQNLRTSKYWKEVCRDGYHLSDLGRYAASLTAIKQLTGANISNVNWKPSNITEEQQEVVIEAVNNAITNPYEVTSSTIAPKQSN